MLWSSMGYCLSCNAASGHQKQRRKREHLHCILFSSSADGTNFIKKNLPNMFNWTILTSLFPKYSRLLNYRVITMLNRCLTHTFVSMTEGCKSTSAELIGSCHVTPKHLIPQLKKYDAMEMKKDTKEWRLIVESFEREHNITRVHTGNH